MPVEGKLVATMAVVTMVVATDRQHHDHHDQHEHRKVDMKNFEVSVDFIS